MDERERERDYIEANELSSADRYEPEVHDPDLDAFADDLAALLDNAGWKGIRVTMDADSATVEGRVGAEWLRLEMAPGAYGVAEGWHVSMTTRTPHED